MSVNQCFRYTALVAPGTADGRFSSFSKASVNASGDIVFYAGVTVGGVQSAGIFKISGGTMSPVVLEGQTLPGSPSQFFGGALGDPQINNSGDVVFSAYFTPAGSAGIFLSSGGRLQKIVDTASAVPQAPGQTFQSLNDPRINDRGDIAFRASLLSGPYQSGVFLLSGGIFAPAALLTFGGVSSLSLNSSGDIAFATVDGISLFSNGSVRQVAGVGQIVPNTNREVEAPIWPSVNDAQDVVFINQFVSGLRGSNRLPNAIIRSRAGVLEKIAANGDPVPGFPGDFFDTSFSSVAVNSAAIEFTGRAARSQVGVIGRYQEGQISIIAREDQLVEGVGTLNFIGESNFDNRQGPLTTFVSNASVAAGVFAAVAGQSTLLFPHIADGTNASGGWHTTFILANRSTAPASATINFYQDSGEPMNVSIGGQLQNQASMTVPALGVAQLQTDGSGPLGAGWARIQADQSLSGIALFGFFTNSGSFLDEVGAPATVPLRSMSVFVESGPRTSTGIALANPDSRGPAAAEVTLILRDSNSTEIARTSVTLPPNGHLAKYAGELFPSAAQGNFKGKIEVVSTLPLIALTLRQQESIFTSLPVIP